jgi:DNA-binding MarR family transcriptional regulator
MSSSSRSSAPASAAKRGSRAAPAEADKKACAAALYSVENYHLHDSVGYLMKRLVSMMSLHIEQILQAQNVGLTNSQWAPMLLLNQGQPVTICQLAREFQTDVGAMTRMVDRLESKGLCKRVRSTTDRRVVQVELTPEGREAIAHVPAVIVRVLNEFLDGFSREEWQTLMALLRRMYANGAALAAPADSPSTN